MPAPERWLVLTFAAPPDDPLRELISEGLLALGGLSVLDEGDRLTTYLQPPDTDPETAARSAADFLADWIGDDAGMPQWRWQENEDWERSWRAGLQPRKVSRRFVVKPSWTDWDAAGGEIVVEVDPEMAFGTGEHPTTRGCLRLLDRYLRDGDRVCDVGSGSGVLAIAASLAGAGDVVAIESDPDANLNARDNLSRNGVADRIVLIERLADPDWLNSTDPFDLIIANILSSVIRPLLPAFATGLRSGGRLIVSGILDEEADSVVREALQVGFRLVEEDREGEWWSAVLEPTSQGQ